MASLGLIGSIGEYKPETEKISSYLERDPIFMDANEVKEEKKAVVLLALIGKECFALLEGLVAPSLPREKSHRELVDALKKHFEPTEVLIVERFHFYKRNQGLTESIAKFAADLRRLALKCEFGEFLDKLFMTASWFVDFGTSLYRSVFCEMDLTNARAIKISQNGSCGATHQ